MWLVPRGHRRSLGRARGIEVPLDGDELDLAECGVDHLLPTVAGRRLDYGPAEGLARATNVSVKGLEEAVLVARGGGCGVQSLPRTGIRPPTSVCRCGR